MVKYVPSEVISWKSLVEQGVYILDQCAAKAFKENDAISMKAIGELYLDAGLRFAEITARDIEEMELGEMEAESGLPALKMGFAFDDEAKKNDDESEEQDE